MEIYLSYNRGISPSLLSAFAGIIGTFIIIIIITIIIILITFIITITISIIIITIIIIPGKGSSLGFSLCC